jgi:hypothetical protein
MGYNSYTPYQWRQPTTTPQRGTTSSFGNTSGLGANIGGGGWDLGMGTGMGMYGGGDPTSTADVNRPPGYGTTTDNNNNQPGSQQQTGGSGQTSPNPDPYNQPWVDYINADGTPHINYQYGNSGHTGGYGGGGGQTSGEGSYWFPQTAPNPNSTIPGVQTGTNPNGTPIYPGSGQQQQQNPYSLPFNWQQYASAPAEQRPVAQEWAQMQLPYQQFMQNSMQYGMDFVEAQRRWDMQYGQTAANDAWNQQFAGRQQTAAEQAQQFAQGNWLAQFAHTSQMDNQQYGLQQQAQALQAELGRAGVDQAQQKIIMDDWMNRQNVQLQQTQLGQQDWMNRQNVQLQQSQMSQEQGQWSKEHALNTIQNQQQYGLQQQAQALQAELGRAGVDQAQQKIIMDDWMNKQNVKLQQQQLGQQQVQFGQTFGLQSLQAQREYELAQQAQQFKYTELEKQASQVAAQQGIDLEQVRNQGWYQQQQADIARQQLAQESELTRWRTGQELGFNREQLQTETGYKYAQLQQQAQLEARRQGIDLQQVQNTGWYQQQQAAIAREQMGQEGTLARERMAQEDALTRWRTGQELAAQREAAAYSAFGRAQNPSARWLRTG